MINLSSRFSLYIDKKGHVLSGCFILILLLALPLLAVGKQGSRLDNIYRMLNQWIESITQTNFVPKIAGSRGASIPLLQNDGMILMPKKDVIYLGFWETDNFSSVTLKGTNNSCLQIKTTQSDDWRLKEKKKVYYHSVEFEETEKCQFERGKYRIKIGSVTNFFKIAKEEKGCLILDDYKDYESFLQELNRDASTNQLFKIQSEAIWLARKRPARCMFEAYQRIAKAYKNSQFNDNKKKQLHVHETEKALAAAFTYKP